MDLTTLDLPSDLATNRKVFIQKLAGQDAAKWYHMERYELLQHLFFLGVQSLSDRQKVANAFRKRCDELNYSPPKPAPLQGQ